MLFSIIIPAYNYGRFLPRALESVLGQDGDDYEILVVDDGSSDDTEEVMTDLCARHPGQIRYLRQLNSGPAAARNRGVAESHGEYLIFLDADDRLLPGALGKFRSFLLEAGPLGMAFGGHRSVYADGRGKLHEARPLSLDRKRNFARYLRKEFGISNGATVMARRVFETIRYPEHLRNSEDIPVFAQTLALFDCLSFAEPVLEVFKHDDSLRNNIGLVMRSGTELVDTLFDPQVLPGDLMGMKSEFRSRQNMSLFRSLYLAGHYKEARSYFSRAIRSQPQLVFSGSSFFKYVRSFFKSSAPSL